MASGEGSCLNLPVVILVNRGSASGSEIVAGAMQDHKRGLIIGSETFGKASVQSVIPLMDESALRLTTARYYTPSGRSIHRNRKTGEGGITPDIVINIFQKVLDGTCGILLRSRMRSGEQLQETTIFAK